MFHATLTLPGIAGVILTIGMAVDANVLTFDRIREEIIARGGGLATTAIERGYSRALSAILDGNVTTLLTALVLMQFGTGPIKGFAVTLSVGILISLFTALFVTRVFQDKVTIGKKNDQISIGPVRFLMDVNFDFMKYGPIWTAFSAVMLTSGAFYTITHWSAMKGIELTGGSMVRVKFEQPTETSVVRSQPTDGLKLSSFQLQQVGTERKEFIVRLKKDAVIPTDQTVVKVVQAEPGKDEHSGQGVIYTKGREPEVDMANYVTVGLDKLNPDFPIEMISMESFSASFGAELATEGIWAVVVSWAFILLYLAFRFQFAYGVAAVVALIHDVAVALGALGISSQFGVIRRAESHHHRGAADSGGLFGQRHHRGVRPYPRESSRQ